MGRTTIIQLTAALVLSLLASVLIFRWMQARQAPQAQGPTNVMIAVAAQELTKGTRIEAESIKMTAFLEESLPTGHFLEAELLHGRVLDSDLAANEPILETRLLDETVTSGGVSTLIAPGKRAVGVKGNKVMGLSGFVHPGNNVDVLVTFDLESTKDGKDYPVTKLVLENVRVLATGTELQPDKDGEGTSSVDVYSLELTPQETEKLALAATRGTLHFALRNPADAQSVKTKGQDAITTLGSRYLPSARMRGNGNKAKRRPSHTVQVISGSTQDTVRFTR